jgi:hypothetical protein
VVARHHADEITAAVALQYERFEDALDRLAQLCGDVRARQVLFVHFIRNQRIRYLRPVEQTGGVGLFDFFRSHRTKIAILRLFLVDLPEKNYLCNLGKLKQLSS